MYNIQHADRNVSAAEYRAFPKDTLLITSIFFTIQGEGPHAGRPAVFIRLAGCNRGDKRTGCEFCDTQFQFSSGKLMSFKEIRAAIDNEIGDHCPSAPPPMLVITGGEPMIQENITWFVRLLTDDLFFVQIESNGDRSLPAFFNFPWNGMLEIIISPKVAGRGIYHSLKPEVWKNMRALKVLIDADEKSPYHEPPYYAFDRSIVSPMNVYLSPMTIHRKPVPPGQIASIWDDAYVDQKRTVDNFRYAAEMAMQNGFRISLQSHMFLGVA